MLARVGDFAEAGNENLGDEATWGGSEAASGTK
jgi:hypothetical protein